MGKQAYRSMDPSAGSGCSAVRDDPVDEPPFALLNLVMSAQPDDKENLVAALLCYDINQSWLTRSGLNRVVENSIKLIPVKMKKGRRLPVIFI